MKRLSLLASLAAAVCVVLPAATIDAAPAPARPYSVLDDGSFKFSTIQEMSRATSVFSTSAAVFTDPVAASLAIGNRLVDLQADVTEDNAGNGAVDADNQDGGWDWVTTGDTEHMGPGGLSYENLYGPIGRGLVEAALFTGDARLGTGADDIFAGISQPGVGALGRDYYIIWNGDLQYAYQQWAAYTANTALADTGKTRYDTMLATYGGAGGRARLIRNGRTGQGIPALWPWDAALLSMDAKALGYSTQLDSISQVIQDDVATLLGPSVGFVPTDFTQSYHQLGLIGALRAYTCSPRVDDDATAAAYRDSIVNGQLANGSWGLSYGGTFYEDDIQTTAYAVLALIEYADKFGPDDAAVEAARKGNAWILTQVDGAGIVDAGGATEYSEVSGEAIQALLAGSMSLGIGDANLQSDCLSATENEFTVCVTITGVTPDPTDVQGMKLNFSFDDAELDLLSIDVPGGSIWGASSDYAVFTTIGAGTGEINVSSLLFGGISAGSGGTVCCLTFERKTGAVGVIDYSISSAEIRDPLNSPIAADLSGAEGSVTRILGDFTTTLVGGATDCGLPGFGPPDGDVDVFDLGVFSNHFGAIDPAAEYCCIVDIGPTTTSYVFGEPTIDGVIDFEDLVIFSISFGFSAIGGYAAPAPAIIPDAPSQVRLVPVAGGSGYVVDLELSPSTGVQALHAILDYDPSVLRFVGAESVAESNFLGVIPGQRVDLNLAALGVENAWTQTGSVARLTFERVGEGSAEVNIASLDLRNSFNQGLPANGEGLTLGGPAASTPTALNFLAPASPNPFAAGSGELVIRFGSRLAQDVELAIFDARGRKVRTLVSGSVTPGEHTVSWNARDDGGSRLTSGIYFARLVYPHFQKTEKIILLP